MGWHGSRNFTYGFEDDGHVKRQSEGTGKGRDHQCPQGMQLGNGEGRKETGDNREDDRIQGQEIRHTKKGGGGHLGLWIRGYGGLKNWTVSSTVERWEK